MSQENVELVLSFIDAANAGDREQLARLRAPGFTRTSARERLGLPVPTGVDQYFDDLEEVWGTLRVEVEQVVDVDEGVLILGRLEAEGRASGISVWNSIAGNYSVRGGHVARIDGYHQSDDAIEAAGLSE